LTPITKKQTAIWNKVRTKYTYSQYQLIGGQNLNKKTLFLDCFVRELKVMKTKLKMWAAVGGKGSTHGASEREPQLDYSCTECSTCIWQLYSLD